MSKNFSFTHECAKERVSTRECDTYMLSAGIDSAAKPNMLLNALVG